VNRWTFAAVAAAAIAGCMTSESGSANPARLYLAPGNGDARARLVAEEPPPY
jgi:hypothetical protein